MKDRIKKVRQHKGISLSQEAFGRKLGVTGAAISKIESGDRNASEQIILGICREFNVSETWLRTGEGDMFRETPDTAVGQLAEELGLDEFMQSVVCEYLKLNEEQRKVVRGFVNNIAGQPINGLAAPTPSLPQVPESPPSIAQELAELKRQNQELAAKVAAMESAEETKPPAVSTFAVPPEPEPQPEPEQDMQLLAIMEKNPADMTDEECALYGKAVRLQSILEKKAEAKSRASPDDIVMQGSA